MGIAMISGIMSMIEIANSLNRHGLYSSPPIDKYSGGSSIAPNADRVFQKALLEKANPQWAKGEEFCTRLKSEATKISTIASNYKVGERSKSEHSRLLNSCSLTYKNHRIVISYKNPTDNKYGLYSCINDSSYYCDLED